MDSPDTLSCTPAAYWPLILTFVLPPAGAVLSAIALWVASKARTTSQDAQSTSQAVAISSGLLPERREHSVSVSLAPVRKK
jgi:hypothetical protein